MAGNDGHRADTGSQSWTFIGSLLAVLPLAGGLITGLVARRRSS
ncbi:hypothetical protein ABZ916_36650 [Streptomyces sp. NPDC046853]